MMNSLDLSQQEILRYSRHLILPEIGMDGQRKLRDASVLLVGAGGLGSPAALYLAAAGIGHLGIVDDDAVDLTNLQRQVLHGTGAIGLSKLASAQARLADLNPHVRVQPYPFRLTSQNAFEVLTPYDVIVDGSDNFPTRYLVNDACVLLGKPLVYGSIFRFEGQLSVFDARRGPCYRCLYAEPPPPGLVPSCAESGVLGVLPGVVGSLQALEALKLVLGQGETLLGRLLLFDALRLRFRELALRKDLDCPVCGTSPTVTSLIDYEAFCGVTQLAEMTTAEVTASVLHAELTGGSAVTLIDVREPHEWDIVRLPDARLIPLRQLPSRLAELDPRSEFVTLCHHGIRSAQARDILLGAGFARVRNLRGGIDSWAVEVDRGMVRY